MKWDWLIRTGEIVGRFLHWCTGWLVHPDKGGCCEMDISEEIKNVCEDLTKDNESAK